MYLKKKCPDCGKTARMELHIAPGGVPFLKCPDCGAVREDRSLYRRVDSGEAGKIIETREPRGLFVHNAGIGIIGIDNRTDDACLDGGLP